MSDTGHKKERTDAVWPFAIGEGERNFSDIIVKVTVALCRLRNPESGGNPFYEVVEGRGEWQHSMII